LTSRQNFLVRSSFIDSLMMLYRVPTWFTAAIRCQARRFLPRS
jgi:hypothetical protein